MNAYQRRTDFREGKRHVVPTRHCLYMTSVPVPISARADGMWRPIRHRLYVTSGPASIRSDLPRLAVMGPAGTAGNRCIYFKELPVIKSMVRVDNVVPVDRISRNKLS